MAIEQNEPLSLTLKVSKFVSSESLGKEGASKCLELEELYSLIKSHIISKLVPTIDDIQCVSLYLLFISLISRAQNRDVVQGSRPPPSQSNSDPLRINPPRNRPQEYDPLRVDPIRPLYVETSIIADSYSEIRSPQARMTLNCHFLLPLVVSVCTLVMVLILQGEVVDGVAEEI